MRLAINDYFRKETIRSVERWPAAPPFDNWQIELNQDDVGQGEQNKIKNEGLQPGAHAEVIDNELEKVTRHSQGE